MRACSLLIVGLDEDMKDVTIASVVPAMVEVSATDSLVSSAVVAGLIEEMNEVVCLDESDDDGGSVLIGGSLVDASDAVEGVVLARGLFDDGTAVE